MRCGFASDIGLVRDENQDKVEAREFGSCILAVVCDGMGGERSGSQASAIAIREVFDRFTAGYAPTLPPDEIRALLLSSVSAANSVVYTTSRMDYKSYGMGTTCVAAFVEPGWISLVNVGDSRAYLVEGDAMRQLTRDHTVVNMLLEQGKITPADMKHHPQRNMLTRAVGVERVVKPDFFRIPYEGDFTLLLCSDGLSGYCSESEILRILRDSKFEDLPQSLVDLAISKGGRDNISLAVITK